jgi:hypothetical protein
MWGRFTFILILFFSLNSLADEVSGPRALELIKKIEKVYANDAVARQQVKRYERSLHLLPMVEEDFIMGSMGAWGRAMSDGTVFIAGGILRHYFSSDDAFVALVCHEIGHLLGGAPASTNNMSYEGQADYYAASVCMKKFFKAYPEELARDNSIYHHYFVTCKKAYSTETDIRICAKIMQGGMNLASASAYEIDDILLPGPGIDEQYVTDKTLVGRDTGQCIADTFEAGALCEIDDSKINFTDEKSSACNNRPKCWYKLP